MHLVDPGHLVFDRVFGGEDAHVHRVDLVEKRIQRCGLARTGRTRDQKNAIRPADHFLDRAPVVRVQSELPELDETAALLQQAEADALAVDRRHGRHADIDILPIHADADPAVHGHPLLGDVHVGHHLEPRNDRRFQAVELLRHIDAVENAVNPIADAQFLFHRFDMDVGGALAVGLGDDLVDETDDRGILPHLADVDLGN